MDAVEAERTWFRNIRSNGGFRLTDHGFGVLTGLGIQSWPVHIPDIRKFMHDKTILLALDHKIRWPYYIHGRQHKLIMFSSREAMMATLYGDISNFLANYG